MKCQIGHGWSRWATFYKLYAPLQANCPQLADNFIEDLYIADIQRVVAQSKNRPQTADDFKLLFLIPWDHHRRIIDKCKGNMDKAFKGMYVPQELTSKEEYELI